MSLPMVRYDLSDMLTLAGQPQIDDWRRLSEEGFRSVVNMRSDPERAMQQQQNAEQAGLAYLHLALPAYELEPEHLAQFHQAMQEQSGRVLLHCRSATRVALMWWLERVIYDGWSSEQAEQALRAAGYGDSSIDTLSFCAADYFERAGIPA